MKVLSKVFNNTGKPTGLLGNFMLTRMNKGHKDLCLWGLDKLPYASPHRIADIGCGGGRNLARLAEMYPDAKITGVDYADESVIKSKYVNWDKVRAGKMRILNARVNELPMRDNIFSLVTAFETVYFWPGPEESLREVYRIMKPGGRFLIVNEIDGDYSSDDKWADIVEGMTIYTPDEMCDLLKETGFSDVQVYRKEKNHWIAFLAVK